MSRRYQASPSHRRRYSLAIDPDRSTMINLTESINSLRRIKRTRGTSEGRGCSVSDLHRARHNDRRRQPRSVSPSRTSSRSKTHCAARMRWTPTPAGSRRLEAQCRVMLPAMAQAHIELHRRRSPASRSCDDKAIERTDVRRDSRVVETGFGEGVSPREGARAHPAVTLRRHHRAEAAAATPIATEVRHVIVLAGVEPRHERAAPKFPHIPDHAARR